MEKPYILHMITTEKNLSPFDVNMALDAGWTNAIPYLGVATDEIRGLVQDAIFSRGPKGVKRTGIFIGGRYTEQAIDMLEAARKAMVPPFEVSVFADPSGAFTTAAGLVACIEKELKKTIPTGLQGIRVLGLGGTGPVGQAAAVIAARAGAEVTITSRQREKAEQIAEMCNSKLAGGETSIKGAADAEKNDLIADVDVVFSTGAAGIELLGAELIARAAALKVAADVNAVPPAGIAGVDAFDDGKPLEHSTSGAAGIGALAIGNVKYQAQNRLLKRMFTSDKPVYLHYQDAFEVAQEFINAG